MKRDTLKEFLDLMAIQKSEEEFLQELQARVEGLSKNESFLRELRKFNALSNKTRLLIYHILLSNDLCTCALARILKVAEGTISHHLKLLEKAGLIMGIKKGYFTIYTTKKPTLQTIQFNP